MQVDPRLSTLSHAWFPRLNLEHDEPRSNYDFNFNLRLYITTQICDSGDYNFVVSDDNGMCCEAGQGSYTLSLIQPDGSRSQIATVGRCWLKPVFAHKE